MILIGLGSNLPAEEGASPKENLIAALSALENKEIKVKATSSFYKSAPVPVSDQPWFINAVAEIETPLGAAEILSILHQIETDMGRTRRIRNEARIIDLDLLDYHGQVIKEGLVLPHPRMHQRHFVLQPLSDLVPNWRHPTLKKTVTDLLEALGPEGRAQRL